MNGTFIWRTARRWGIATIARQLAHVRSECRYWPCAHPKKPHSPQDAKPANWTTSNRLRSTLPLRLGACHRLPLHVRPQIAICLPGASNGDHCRDASSVHLERSRAPRAGVTTGLHSQQRRCGRSDGFGIWALPVYATYPRWRSRASDGSRPKDLNSSRWNVKGAVLGSFAPGTSTGLVATSSRGASGSGPRRTRPSYRTTAYPGLPSKDGHRPKCRC